LLKNYCKTTDEATDETTSHPTKQPEDGCQVVGYSHSEPPKNGGQAALVIAIKLGCHKTPAKSLVMRFGLTALIKDSKCEDAK
jgi:hypothetical protein